jgi:hypothetical protein
MYNKLTNIYFKNVLLNEFTEAAINTFLKKFRTQASSMVPDSEIKDNIEKFDKIKNSPRFLQIASRLFPNIKQPQDPTNYSYSEFEAILNWFGDYKSSVNVPLLPEEEPGVAPPILYDDGSLIIYSVYTHEQARNLITDVIPQRVGRNFNYCVQDSTGYYWRSYRMNKGQTFYFVVDTTTRAPGCVNYVLVIRPELRRTPEGESTIIYNVADVPNRDRVETWENIVKLQPKLENKKDLFTPRQFTRAELVQRDMGQQTDAQSFSRMSYQSKVMYISLGRKIYMKDYELLDKDLQNSYINAREREWGTAVFSKTEIPFFGLFFPFEVHIERHSMNNVSTSYVLMSLLLSFLYVKKGEEGIIDLLPVIKKSSNSVIKRYFELLSRYRNDIITKTYTPTVKILPLLWSSIELLLQKYPVGFRNHIDPTERNLVNDLYNYIQKNSLANLLSDDEKQLWVSSGFFITRAQFADLNDELQKTYIDTWFASNGTFNQNTGIMEYQTKQTNILDFLLDSNTTNTLWVNILNYKSLSEVIKNVPGISSASSSVQNYFLKQLETYSE